MNSVRIEDLILLRSWCAGEDGITTSGLRQALGGLLPAQLNTSMLRDRCNGLVKDELLMSLARSKFRITGKGEQALSAFGLPSKTVPWTKAKDTFLLACCLGISSLGKKPMDGIRVALLRESCEIPAGASLTAAVDRFLRGQLRQAGAKNLKAAVIWRALGVKGSVTETVQSPAISPLPVESFAKTVTAAALRTHEGWLGNKVLISHVWRTIQASHELPGMTIEVYKEFLLFANRQGLLTLSRADLSHLLDQTEVRESEIQYLNATFHFLTVNKNEDAV
jgi:hypothetical protein